MHSRRLACLLLGGWLAGSVFMTVVAAQNFRAVDRLLARPAPAAGQLIGTLGPNAARGLLRYQVSELNRLYFATWETAQLGIGLLLFFLLLFGSPEGRLSLGLSLVMLAVVVTMRFALTPEIVALGRVIDFVPPELPTPERQRFWVLHSVYSALEVAKWAIGAALAVHLVRRHHHAASRRRAEATR